MLIIVECKEGYKEYYNADSIRRLQDCYYLENSRKDYEIKLENVKKIIAKRENEEHVVYQVPPTKEEIKERIKQEEIKELEEEIEQKASKDGEIKDLELLKKYLDLIEVRYQVNWNRKNSSDYDRANRYLYIPLIKEEYGISVFNKIDADIRKVIKKVLREMELNKGE